MLAAAVLAVAIAGGAYYATRGPEGPTGLPALLALLPAETTAACLVPDVGVALTGVKALKDRFRQHLAAVEPLLAEASRVAGFDLQRPETMAEIGLRPGGGFAAAAGADFAALAFAVDDRDKFEGYVTKRFAAEAGGTLTWHDAERAGVKVRIARTGRGTGSAGDAAGAEASDVFGLAYIHGHAVVAPTRDWKGNVVDPAASLARIAAVQPATSLASRADLTGPLGTVGPGRAAYLLSDLASGARLGADAADAVGRNRDAQALRKAAEQVRGLAAAIDVGAGGLRVPFSIGGDPAAAKALADALRPAGKGPDYARVAPDDGLLVLTVAFNPVGLLPWLRATLLDHERQVVDRALTDSTAKAGKDLEKDILPLLSGHAGFVFQNLDVATLGQRLLQNLGATTALAAEQPGAITTTTFVGLKDPAGVTRLIEEALAAAEAKAGAPLPDLERQEGQAAWRLRQGGAEVVGFAVQGDVLVVTTGVDRLAGALARLSGAKDAPPGLGERVVVPDARAGLSPDNNLGFFLSAPVIFRSFPVLNLWKPAAPARQLAEVVLTARAVPAGVDGELMVTVPPPPPPAAGGQAPDGGASP